MAIALAITGVAVAAFCVWLTVRIVNRKERWAKWTLAALVLLAYPLSFGPACWLTPNGDLDDREALIARYYRPLVQIARSKIPIVSPALNWYGCLAARNSDPVLRMHVLLWIVDNPSASWGLHDNDDYHFVDPIQTGRVPPESRDGDDASPVFNSNDRKVLIDFEKNMDQHRATCR